MPSLVLFRKQRSDWLVVLEGKIKVTGHFDMTSLLNSFFEITADHILTVIVSTVESECST